MSGFHPTKQETGDQIFDVIIVGGGVPIVDGADSNIEATVLDKTNSNPLAVAIVDASGDQITSFGGGTQYTEGDTDASITGTAMLWEDGSDTLRAVSSAKPLPVEIIAGAGSGGTAAADDADFTAGTTSGTPAMGVYESTPTSVTDGDMGIVGITQGRRLKTSATIDAALPAGTNNIGDVDVLSSALPTGAATEATLSSIDTSTGDIVAPIQNLGSAYTTEDVASQHQDGGLRMLVVRKDTPANTSGTDGDYEFLQISAGRLWASATIDAALPAGTNAIGKLAANSGVDIGDVDVTSIVPGTGATNLGKAVDSIAGSTDTGVVPLAIRDNSLTTITPADGDYAPMRLNQQGALWVQLQGGVTNQVRLEGAVQDDGTFTPGIPLLAPIGMFADETSTDSVDEGDLGVPRMTLDRKQIATLYPSSTAGDGLSIFRSLDLDETEEDVKTSAGNVYGYYFGNVATSVRYLKFYNATAANVTVGTTTPVMTLPLPASSSGHISFPYPIAFSTAISVACTTGVADNDTGAPSANDVIINCFYR